MDEDSLEQVSAYVARFGVAARPLREAVAALIRGPQTVGDLVTSSGLPRRSVEGLLEALDGDVERGPQGMVLRPERAPSYRERFALPQLERTRLPDPLAGRLADNPALAATMERFVAAAPAPVRSLDHVTATPQTAARRALWLDAYFDLAGARLLCVGDHDLTSLAACTVNPDLSVTVIDLDERILAFIDDQSRQRGWDVRCLYADVRHDLPPAASGRADLVVTDPPYTPEGTVAFLARGLQGLRDREHGRLVMAYGFGDSHPGLGLKVQRSVQRMHLAFEAILPGFNHYHGAQAIGGTSDLYICRPTARTWQTLDRLLHTAVTGLYTQGSQSRDAAPPVLDAEIADAVDALASDSGQLPVSLLVGEAWPESTTARVSLAQLIARGGTPGTAGRALTAVADLSNDPGPWLLRALLAANARRLALLVPNSHPDVASETAQRQLTDLVRAKYTLRFHRSAPTARHAVVVADRVNADQLAGSDQLVRRVLDRAHGTVSNVWREGLIALSQSEGPASLTKKQARERIRAACDDHPRPLDARLVDLPRHQIGELLDDVAASAR